MNGTNMHFVLVCFFSPLNVSRWAMASARPLPLFVSYALFICFLIVILDGEVFIHAAASSSFSLSLYVRHIRHSSLAEFDSITAQISSHYLSTEYSLNVNVFLGRLHQREILKNIPLIDERDSSSPPPPPTTHLPSLWCCGDPRCGAGLVIRLRTSVIGLIRAASREGAAPLVMPYINTLRTCS